MFSLDVARSSSWKNHYLQVFKELYGEYVWKTGLEIVVPTFPRFSNSSKKADVFSTDELNQFFNCAIWDDEAEFLLFYVTVNCGLRMGEARGLKAKQFNFKKHILIVDGFIRFDGSRTNFNKSGSIREKKIRVVFLPKEKSSRILEEMTFLEKILFSRETESRSVRSSVIVFLKKCSKSLQLRTGEES